MARLVRLVLWASPLLLSACADLWGFQDGTVRGDAGRADSKPPAHARDAEALDASRATEGGDEADASRDSAPESRPGDDAAKPCTAASDCPANQACSDGVCGTACSRSIPCNGGCCAETTCSAGTAGATCGSDGTDCHACMGLTSACSAGACVECNAASDCMPPKTCVAHTCAVACTGASECPAGMACGNGVCGPACSASSPCNGGCCASGMCTNGMADNACGTTGVACDDCQSASTNQQCVMGVCGCNDPGHCASHLCFPDHQCGP